jgi:hypothetical protein
MLRGSARELARMPHKREKFWREKRVGSATSKSDGTNEALSKRSTDVWKSRSREKKGGIETQKSTDETF